MICLWNFSLAADPRLAWEKRSESLKLLDTQRECGRCDVEGRQHHRAANHKGTAKFVLADLTTIIPVYEKNWSVALAGS